MVNSSQSVNEDDGSVRICVDSGITGSVQTELLVTLSSSAGKACKIYNYIFKMFANIYLTLTISSFSCWRF